jgi:hypothetical protein
MMFKEVISIYNEDHTYPELQNAELLIVKVAGMCIDQGL